MRRPTMKDIAEAAGVSRGAASFALNDRPGVSEETRARVKRVAAEMGWTPSPAALALSTRRARAIGLVLARDLDSFASEGFFLKLISGIEQVLQPKSLALMLQVVPDIETEMQVCRSWWAEGRVDGLLLVDPWTEDPRPALLAELGLPAVAVGGGERPPLLSGLVTDDRGAMREVVEHLHQQRHRRIAYVQGIDRLAHTSVRAQALREAAALWGMEVTATPSTDFSEVSGRWVTQTLLTTEQPPTAIIYDNEILALGGLAAVYASGRRCPEDIAIVSCEDSPICRVVQPTLTALVRDPRSLGVQATRMLLDLVEGAGVRREVNPAPTLVVRGSSVSP